MTAIAEEKNMEHFTVPEGYRLVRDPSVTDMLANNVRAAASVMSVAVAHRRDGGEVTEDAETNLRIIRRWADMLLNGETPRPGDAA